MIVVGVILGLLAISLLVVGGLGFAKKLPGNKFVGIRVAEVRSSEEIWVAAHHVAGAFWLLGGVALAFGAMTAFVAEGWMWLIPVGAVLVALVAIGAGANVGARTAAALSIQREVEKANQPEAAPSPQVDLDALRRVVNQPHHQPGNAHHNTPTDQG